MREASLVKRPIPGYLALNFPNTSGYEDKHGRELPLIFPCFFQALPVHSAPPPKKNDKRMSSAPDNAPPTLSVTS